MCLAGSCSVPPPSILQALSPGKSDVQLALFMCVGGWLRWYPAWERGTAWLAYRRASRLALAKAALTPRSYSLPRRCVAARHRCRCCRFGQPPVFCLLLYHDLMPYLGGLPLGYLCG